MYMYKSSRIVNNCNLLNVLVKRSSSDVSQSAELVFTIFFMVNLSDPAEVFKRSSLFRQSTLKTSS